MSSVAVFNWAATSSLNWKVVELDGVIGVTLDANVAGVKLPFLFCAADNTARARP